ncbi:TPA: hypothetical protein QA377_004332 [Raoultella ornithinolytica]|nr:hypothetical protein [Raoultella ornithinolytica]
MSLISYHQLLHADILSDGPIDGQLNAQRLACVSQLIRQSIDSGRPLQYSIYLGHLSEHTRFPFNRVDAWMMALDMQRRAGGVV